MSMQAVQDLIRTRLRVFLVKKCEWESDCGRRCLTCRLQGRHCLCVQGCICWCAGLTSSVCWVSCLSRSSRFSKQLKKMMKEVERSGHTSGLGSPYKWGRESTNECRLKVGAPSQYSALFYITAFLRISCVFWICFSEKPTCLYLATHKSHPYIPSNTYIWIHVQFSSPKDT